jgi:CubicO group peptidase (beta-lactamase class C family)
VAPTPIPTETPAPFHYKVPQKFSDGWSVGDLRGEKVDFQKMTQAMNGIYLNQLRGIHSLLVFRHSQLLLEEYFSGYDSHSTHQLYSCTKSVFSTVYGIAQDQGLLSLNQKLYDLYPDERSKGGWNSKKDAITIGNLLSMTTGLDCNDVGVGNDNCGSVMDRSADWLAFCFALPMAHPVGTAWMYNGCCLTLVAKLIAQKSGVSFPDYARKVLLGPLGIAEDTWVTGPGDLNRVDYGLEWKARDMGKLGQLYLNQGMWKGKRIVSEAWVKDATAPHAPEGQAFGHDYGYLWHLKAMRYQEKPVRVFYANGYHGQAIFVSPEADLVCVMTAESDDRSIYTKEEGLFERDILGAFH